MADIFRVHEVARIRTGKYRGLVGTVTETRQDDTGKQTGVRVWIDGTSEGRNVSTEKWFKRSEVERNNG